MREGQEGPAANSSLLSRLRIGPRSVKRLLWWFRAAVTLILTLYLVWRVRVEVGTLRFHLARPLWLVVALAQAVLAIILSVRLWYILIPGSSRVPFLHLLANYLTGLFWNNFLPSTLGGDAVRVLALRACSGRTDVAIHSVLMTRIAGLWGITLLAAGSALVHTADMGWQEMQPFLLIVAGVLLITICSTAFLLNTPLGILRRWLPKAVSHWRASLHAYYGQPIRLLETLAYALAIQVCAVLVNVFTALALDLNITPGQLWLSLPLINLATAVPISLGGFGVREASHVYLLGLVGVSASDAIVLSLSVYALLALIAALGAGISVLLSWLQGATRREDTDL